MITKKCFKCGKEKPLDDFYSHPRMKDGHLGKCKACTKSDVHLRGIEHKDERREYERKRWLDPARRAANARAAKEWGARNPEKKRAQVAINNAVRDGRIIKPEACDICGQKARLHGHHTDYSEPLIVVWMCVRCHSAMRGQP